MSRTTDILRSARDMLATAELGLRDLREGDPRRRVPGLWSAIVYGRAVTNVLQNLRGCEPTFDDWYVPRAAALKADPSAKALYKLRSRILKEGTAPAATMFHAKHLELPLDPDGVGPPPGASRTFVAGDGVGWIVDLADGHEEKYYVKLPLSAGEVETFLVGQDGALANAVDLLERYLGQMRSLVDEAESAFANAG